MRMILGYNYMLFWALNTILFAMPKIRCDLQWTAWTTLYFHHIDSLNIKGVQYFSWTAEHVIKTYTVSSKKLNFCITTNNTTTNLWNDCSIIIFANAAKTYFKHIVILQSFLHIHYCSNRSEQIWSFRIWAQAKSLNQGPTFHSFNWPRKHG